MSTLPAQTHLTPEEYLTWERKQPFKNEYRITGRSSRCLEQVVRIIASR